MRKGNDCGVPQAEDITRCLEVIRPLIPLTSGIRGINFFEIDIAALGIQSFPFSKAKSEYDCHRHLNSHKIPV